jgi:cell division protein FtsL
MNGTHAAHGWRNLAVLREHDHRGTRWLFAVVAGIVVALSPFVFYLLRQIDYVHVRYQIEDLRGQNNKLIEAERRLRMEQATLESLPRVEERAVRDLGLVRPSPERVVVIRGIPPGAQHVRAPDTNRPIAR